MTVAATQLKGNAPSLEVGTVIAAEPERFVVATDGGEYHAERAVSCLVEPEPADLVLLSTLPTGAAFVLAVLTRQGGATTLSVEGDLQIRPRDGSVTVASQKGVHLAAGEEVSMVSGRLQINAVEGVIGLQQLSYVGRFVQSEVEKIKLFAGTLDSWLDRLSQKAKRVYRTVEQLEQLKAARVDYSARETMRLHAKHTLMTAQQLVKLDGEQIHMG